MILLILIIAVSAKISPTALGCPVSLTCEANQVEVNLFLDQVGSPKAKKRLKSIGVMNPK